MKNREPWNFCETPKEKCTMNYCDENGCQNRKRNYVEDNDSFTISPKEWNLFQWYYAYVLWALFWCGLINLLVWVFS